MKIHLLFDWMVPLLEIILSYGGVVQVTEHIPYRCQTYVKMSILSICHMLHMSVSDTAAPLPTPPGSTSGFSIT